tara:strand:- start:755 stop:5278 length:4524 start_codon:yes stop_codon:yes gene_type:complete
MSKKYIESRDLRYSYAVDIKKKLTEEQEKSYSKIDKYTKSFGGFNTYEEFNRFCKNIKNKSVYQIINKDIVKFYWDFDTKDFDNGVCNEDKINELIDKIINGIQYCFDTTIDRKDIIVETDKNIGMYKSIHIIINNYKVNKSEIKLMNTYLIDNGMKLDNSVYSKYRQFRLLGMKKLYKEDSNTLINHKDNYYIDFKSHIISDTNDCVLINMKDTIKEDLVKKTITIIENENTIEKTDKEIFVDFVDSNLVYNLMTDLDTKLFSKSKSGKKISEWNWVMITKLIIRELNSENNEVKTNTINDWCRISSDKSNGEYSEEDNREFIRNIDLDNIKHLSINTLCKLCNKYLSYNLSIRKIKICNEMVDYIVDKTNMTKYNILMCIDSVDLNTEKYIEFSEDTYWDIKEQILIHNKTLYNYNELEYMKRINELEYEIEYDKSITDINDMEIYNKQLVDKTIDILIYKAKWGTGKSYFGMRKVITELIDNNEDCRILVITENNSLNSEVLHKYRKYGFKSHTENDWEDTNRLIISVESSIYVNEYDWDLVVLDEYETICNQYESEETLSNINSEKLEIDKDKVIYHNYLNLIKIIKSCDRLLVMDADISKNRIDWLKETTDKKIYSVYIDINNFSDYTINQYVSCNQFNNDLYEDFKNKKKIMFSSSSKKVINKYFRTLQELNKVDNCMKILSITGNGAEIDIRVKTIDNEWVSKKYTDSNGDCMNSENLKELIKKDIEKFVIDNEIDILLYTPSIKTGISMDSEYFDKHYSYGKSGSVNCRTYNQMLFRARQLKDKQFNIFISGSMKLNRYIGVDRMGEVFMNISNNYNNNNYKNGLFGVNENDKNCMKLDKHYYQLRMNNKVEDFNSNINFNSDFITKMKLIHKLNHNYIIDSEIELEMEKLLDNSNDMIKKERLELLVNTKLITKREYEEIKEKVEYNKINKTSKLQIETNEWNEKYKYELLFGFYECDMNDRYKRYNFNQLKELYDSMNEYDLVNSNYNVLSEVNECFDNTEYEEKKNKLMKLIDRKFNSYDYEYTNEEYEEYKIYRNKQLEIYDMDTTTNYIDIVEFLYNKNVVKLKDTDYKLYNEEFDNYYIDSNDNIRIFVDMCEILNGIYNKKLHNQKLEIVSNRYNENMNVYTLLNVEEFYELWDCKDTYDKWKMCYKTLNTDIKYNVEEEQFVEENVEQKENEILVKKSLKYNINIGYIKKLLEVLEITDIRNTYRYTNREFRSLLIKKLDKLIELDNEYCSNLTELDNKTIMKNDFRKEITEIISINDKKKSKNIEKNMWKKYKLIIISINDWLSKINIRIKFLDKNVNSDSGKLKISFNDNHKFNSEIEVKRIIKELSEYECSDILEVKKIKKGYKDNNKKSIYKSNTSKYVENDNVDLSFDIVDNRVVLELDFNYDKTIDNEVFRRYKHKQSKNMCKKKDNDITKLINDNYELMKEIKWCRYNNLVNEYTNDRIDNIEKIDRFINPLKEELMKKFNEKNSPVMTKIEYQVKLGDMCMID